MSDLAPSPPSNRPPPFARPEPPYDPAAERIRILRGLVIDLAVLASVVVLAVSKTVSGDAAVALIAAMAGAGAVHKGGGVVAGKLATGGAVVALVSGLAGRGGDA